MNNVINAEQRFLARRQANNSDCSLEQTAFDIKDSESSAKYQKYCQEISVLLKSNFISSKYFYYYLDGSEQCKQDELAEKACYFYSIVDGLVWRVIEYKMSSSDKQYQYRLETADYNDQDQTYIINPNQQPTRIIYSYVNNNNPSSDYIDVLDSSSNTSLCRLNVLEIMLNYARPIPADQVNLYTKKASILNMLKIDK